MVPKFMKTVRKSSLLFTHGVIAALLVLLVNVVPASAQAGDPVQPWNCLMNATPTDAVFKPMPPPGCSVPAVAWPGHRIDFACQAVPWKSLCVHFCRKTRHLEPCSKDPKRLSVRRALRAASADLLLRTLV